MKKILFLILMIIDLKIFAQVNIVPIPVNASIQGNVTAKFTISNKTIISYNDASLKKDVIYFIKKLQSDYGITLSSKFEKLDFEKEQNIPINTIAVTLLSNSYQNDEGKEYYRIFSGTYSMQIMVNASEGFFHATQTILQLLKRTTSQTIELPIVSIKDYPRFAYRGMHLDVSRHFFPVSYIKKYLDYLAYYKFNTFHWHLTDDQGWRIEIKKYPLLTQIGGYRNGTIIDRFPGKGNDSIRYGGFYTQQQIKEIVQYAADRYITVIPEIEMPGHASAAIAAYPQLSCFPEENTEIDSTTAWAGSRQGKQVQQTWGVFNDVFVPTDYTFNFIENVLDEVMPLFPSTYIHIGGDECPKENWKRSPFCQQLIKSNNLKDEHGLQSYFIQRIEKYVNSKGKKIIGWDEILEGGLAPNAAVMSWRGIEGGIAAAKENHDVVMTPGSHCYFDHSQSSNEDSVTIGGYLPLEKVYSYEPIPAVLTHKEATHILGAQANVWTEYITNEKKLEYMIFPRMAALAEVLWSKKESRNWSDFERRLPTVFETYKKWKVNFSQAYFEPTIVVSPTKNKEGLQITVNSKMKKLMYYFGNKTKSEFKLFTDSISATINESGEYGVRLLGDVHTGEAGEKWGSVSLSPYQYLFKTDLSISVNKSTGKKVTLVTEPSAAYPGNGAFTLVDGLQNTKALARSGEFLGFNGKDLEAVVDLGKLTEIKEIRLHIFARPASWIYPPKQNAVMILVSNDGVNFSKPEPQKVQQEGTTNVLFKIVMKEQSFVQTRYIKIIAENYGIIPSGNPGAGNPAWLFVDEIEVL
ncbi:MAG: family 20 glycosylhydrolase [Ferruginibacter sp.]